MTVEQLQQKLRLLALERQAFCERGAAADDLEQNRLGIVRAQWQLSHALIELHEPHGLNRAA